MNKELLKEIKEAILNESHLFDMRYYFATHSEYDSPIKNMERMNKNGISIEKRKKWMKSCNATACIAGWACVLSKEEIKISHVYTLRDQAKKLLDLTDNQMFSLFYVQNWMSKSLKEAYNNSGTEKKRAKVAAKYIDKFIECEDTLKQKLIK